MCVCVCALFGEVVASVGLLSKAVGVERWWEGQRGESCGVFVR